VAEKVTEQLRARGLEVETRDGGSVRSVDGYDAVVFGGALYYFRLMRAGQRFFRRHHKALAATPLAVFGMGPIEEEEGQMEMARGHLGKTLDKYPELAPASVAIFGGVLQPEKLRNPAMKKMGSVDLRDWDEIAAWADSLPAALGLSAER
jgi:menaquinone-dependent protoporphyrinogen oxidase